MDYRVAIALERCTHDLCMCGEETPDGRIIGYDTNERTYDMEEE